MPDIDENEDDSVVPEPTQEQIDAAAKLYDEANKPFMRPISPSALRAEIDHRIKGGIDIDGDVKDGVLYPDLTDAIRDAEATKDMPDLNKSMEITITHDTFGTYTDKAGNVRDIRELNMSSVDLINMAGGHDVNLKMTGSSPSVYPLRDSEYFKTGRAGDEAVRRMWDEATMIKPINVPDRMSNRTPEQIAENRDNTGRQLPYRAVSPRELTTLEWRMLQEGYTHDDILEYRRRTDPQIDAVMAALDRDRAPDAESKYGPAGQTVREILSRDGMKFVYVPKGPVTPRKPLDLTDYMLFIDKSKPAPDGFVHVTATKKRPGPPGTWDPLRSNAEAPIDFSYDFSEQEVRVQSALDPTPEMEQRLKFRKQLHQELDALDQKALYSEARPKQRVTMTKEFLDAFKEHMEDRERMRLRKRKNRKKTSKKRKQRLMGKRS